MLMANLKLNYKLILLIILLSSILNSSCQNNRDYISSQQPQFEVTTEHSTADPAINITTHVVTVKLETTTTGGEDEEDYDEGEEEEEQECTADALVEKLKYIFTPDDYDEGLARWERGETDDDLIAIYERLQVYKQNISLKISGIKAILENEIKDLFISLPLSPQCFRSFVRIGNAIQEKDEWGLNCKLIFFTMWE